MCPRVVNVSHRQPNTEPGDVIFIVVQKQHAVFQRKGLDLKMEKKLTLVEALTGFEFTIDHLDGQRQLVVKSQPGEIIKPGQIKSIKDEGMPQRGNPFHKGKLFIEFQIEFPDKGFNAEQVAQLKAMLQTKPAAALQLKEDHEEVKLTNDLEESEEPQEYDDDQHGHHQQHGVQCAQS